MNRQTLDDLHGDVIVASVTITLSRAMNMAISGTITDEDYILKMLESATEYLKSQVARRKLQEGSGVVIASHDTALYRTPLEQRLLAARDEISNAMVGK